MSLQLLIIGNGFDLHCGLKSSYKDFFRGAIIDTTTENFGIQQLRSDVSGFWESVLLSYYLKYKHANYNWCDIEAIIKNTLCAVYFGEFDSSSTNLDHGVWKSALDCIRSRNDPEEEMKHIDDIVKRFLFYACAQGFYEKIDIFKEYPNQYYLNLLTEHLITELHSFEKRFCKYIKNNITNPNNEDELNNSYIVNAVNLIAKLTGFHNGDFRSVESFISSEVKEVEKRVSPYQSTISYERVSTLSKEFNKLKQVYILSFNYTALFDILGVKSPCLFSNVHGKLCNKRCTEKCNSSSVIFGIDDGFIKSHNEYSELRVFSKTYRKMSDTSAPVSILPPNGVPIEIKFFGHSLSEADYSYFQSIFDFYNLYSNNNVRLIFYYSKGFEQTDEIYRLINSYGKTLTNQEQGKNLIHKLLLENRLKIVEVKD